MTDDALDRKSAFRANQARRGETKNTIGFSARRGDDTVSGKTEAYTTSTSLAWARKQGLNCELDIMAEQLRMQCRSLVQGWIVIALIVASFFFFAGKGLS